MNKSIYRFFQCMIVLGLATYLAEKLINGQLSFYINLRFAIFTLIGFVGLSIMAVVGLLPLFTEEKISTNPKSESEPKKPRTNFVVLFLIPIITAIFGLSTTVILTMFIFVFVMGLARLNLINKTEHNRRRYQLSEIPGTALILMAIPLILGVFVPVRPLSTSSLSTRGIDLSAPISIGQQSVKTMEVAPDDRTVLDWIKIFNYGKDQSSYLGKSANVVGFVYHDPRLKNGQFMVGRFAITCCVADAFAVGMVVNWPDSANLADNSWVNVKGTIDISTIDGHQVPVIQAEVINPIKAPEQPYLYP